MTTKRAQATYRTEASPTEASVEAHLRSSGSYTTVVTIARLLQPHCDQTHVPRGFYTI